MRQVTKDLHGLTKSEWKRHRLRKLRIAKGWEAVTPKWRNKHLTRAYHKADIVSKSKQMARWRRDDPVDLPIPIKLYGKLLPKQLFDPDWLAEHRKELEEEPYCIRINDNDIDGWEESHHPLGEDTSDEMEWSDAKESSLRGRQLTSAPSSSRDRGSNTQSPAPIAGSSSVPITRPGEDSKAGSSTPVLQASSSALAASEAAQPEADKAPESKTLAQTASEAEATSSISGSSRSGNVDTADTGDTGASESESDVSTTDKPPPHPPKPTPCQCPIRSILLSPSDLLNTVQLWLRVILLLHQTVQSGHSPERHRHPVLPPPPSEMEVHEVQLRKKEESGNGHKNEKLREPERAKKKLSLKISESGN